MGGDAGADGRGDDTLLLSIIHYFYLGPMYAVSGGLVDSRMRATSVAVTLFIVNLFGYGLGPLVMGALSTFLKTWFLEGQGLGLTLDGCKALIATAAPDGLRTQQAAACAVADARGLQWSIIIFICGYAWAALHYLLAAKTLEADMIASKP